MRLFLDTEFNGFGGRLISMALVSETREWYQVLKPTGMPDEWVMEHVLPFLYTPDTTGGEGTRPCDFEYFVASLEGFLSDFKGAEIIADWPADFEHFANLLSEIGKNGGFKEAFPCTMRLINVPGQLKPEVPHNALSDARALRDWYMAELAAA